MIEFLILRNIKNLENTGNKTNRDRNSKQAINQTS